MDLCEDDCDEEALRLAALQSCKKPKFINTNNLIPITTNPFSGIVDHGVKLEPISPSREQTFVDEKRMRLEKQEKESEEKTEDDLLDEDDDSFEGLLNQLQASIEGTVKTKEVKKLEEEVEFLDVKTNKRDTSREIITLESPPSSPRPTYRSRSRSRRRSRSWSRSPRLKRYSLSRSLSPRYRRRRSKSWSPSPSRSPRNSFRPRSPYRSPRRWSRSPRRRRSRSPRPRSPLVKKRSLTPRRSPRRRSRTRTPPRIRSRSPVNRARKRDSPVRRRSPSPRRRHRPRRRSEDEKKKSEDKPSEPLDPVLEARRKKFQSVPNENKKISLKAVKDTIEPVSETGLEIRLDALSDDSEDSDGQEGRFKCNTQPQTRGKLLSFRSIREGNTVVPPARLEPVSSQPRYKPERIRLKKSSQKREASPKATGPVKLSKVHEEVEKKVPAVEVVSPVNRSDVGRISVKKDLFPSKQVEPVEDVEEEEPDLRSILAKKRKERLGGSNLLPLGSRLVQSALQHLGQPKAKQPRRILVVDNSQQITVQPPSRSVPKRRVRKVQDLEPISLLAEDSEPDEVIRPHKRKLKAKRSVTIASQVTN